MRNTNCNTSIINAQPLWFTAGRKKKISVFTLEYCGYVVLCSANEFCMRSFVGEFPNTYCDAIRRTEKCNSARTLDRFVLFCVKKNLFDIAF